MSRRITIWFAEYPGPQYRYDLYYNNRDSLTVQDLLDKYNRMYFHRIFNYENTHRNITPEKCKQFVELYTNRADARLYQNPLSKDRLIKNIDGGIYFDRNNHLWFNLDRDKCERYIAELQMAQIRKAFAWATKDATDLNYDLMGAIGSKMKSNKPLDYDMDERYEDYIKEKKLIPRRTSSMERPRDPFEPEPEMEHVLDQDQLDFLADIDEGDIHKGGRRRRRRRRRGRKQTRKKKRGGRKKGRTRKKNTKS
tara:strand:- start:116 stop:871 length:756 start_codon:yes stop_codon:yes gene_type:complete